MPTLLRGCKDCILHVLNYKILSWYRKKLRLSYEEIKGEGLKLRVTSNLRAVNHFKIPSWYILSI